MNKPFLAGAFIVATGVLLACDHAGPAASGGAPSIDDLPEWKLKEDLRIGELARPDYMLTVVSSLIVAQDGRMYVGQIRDRVIRVYDARGNFATTIGRRGQGPGEFGNLGAIGFRGDTLWVNDWGNRRVSLWTLEGKLVSEFSYDVTSPVEGLGKGAPLALLSNGLVLHLFGGGVTYQGLDVPVMPRDLIGRASRDNLLADTLFTLTYPHVGVWYLASNSDGERVPSYVSEPFKDQPLLAVSPYGDRMVLVNREAATNRAAARFRATSIDPVSAARVPREYSYTPQPLRAEVVDSVLRLKGASKPETSLAYRNGQALRERMLIPEFVAPVTDARTGGEGTLWLERGWTDKKWMVIKGDGSPLALVALPQDFTMYHADLTHIWGYQESADGVPQIVRYKLIK